MKREAFFQNVKKAAFERVYFFYGPEEYVKASALAALRGALLPEGQGCIGSLHLLPYFPPGSAELAQAVASLARQGKCVLLAKHGLVAWGQSPAEALAIAEATEQLAKVNYLCEQLQRI